MIVYSKCLFLFTDYCLLWRSQPDHWVQTQFNGWMDEWMKTFLTLFILSPWSHLFISALFSGSRESFFQQKSWLNWNAHPKVASRDHRCFVCFSAISHVSVSSQLCSLHSCHMLQRMQKRNPSKAAQAFIFLTSPALCWPDEGTADDFFLLICFYTTQYGGHSVKKNIHKPR